MEEGKMAVTEKDWWGTDLSDLEKLFLPKGKKITDLKIVLDNRVPAQNGILLNSIFNIDDVVKPMSWFLKISFYFKRVV